MNREAIGSLIRDIGDEQRYPFDEVGQGLKTVEVHDQVVGHGRTEERRHGLLIGLDPVVPEHGVDPINTIEALDHHARI